MIDLLHLIKRDECTLAFHPLTYSILDLTPKVFEILSLHKEGHSVAEIASVARIEEKEILKLFDKLEQSILSIPIPSASKSVNDKRHIYRITLHIANDCNLRCRYCYAAGGNYGQERELMSYKTADSFIDFCVQNFDVIEKIVFFGGEPLLNPKIIDYICNQFKERYRHGEVIQMPDFGVITNGTLMNNRILDVLKKHISYITVSIDGPQYINDANRIFPDGKGSYEKVMSFINTIKQDTNISIRYEATYTDFCVKQNVMHTDIYNFFKSMGLDGVVTDDTNIKSTVIKKTEKPVTNFSDLELPEGFWSILSAIARREPKQTCQIVNEMFAVSAVGDIYACHMDNGIAEAKLGSIFGKNIFNSPKDYYDKHPLIPLLTDKEKLCGDCWAKNICAGCTRKWFFNSEDSRYYPTPNEDLCIRNQRHIDEIILLIAKIRKNPLLWNELLSIVYHRNNQDCNE